MKKIQLLSLLEFILEIDWLTTKDFCNRYGIPHPTYTGNIKTSADQFLSIDAIKHKMFVEYAKLLNKPITDKILVENFGFVT
jgi:hypothetical protein